MRYIYSLPSSWQSIVNGLESAVCGPNYESTTQVYRSGMCSTRPQTPTGCNSLYLIGYVVTNGCWWSRIKSLLFANIYKVISATDRSTSSTCCVHQRVAASAAHRRTNVWILPLCAVDIQRRDFVSGRRVSKRRSSASTLQRHVSTPILPCDETVENRRTQDVIIRTWCAHAVAIVVVVVVVARLLDSPLHWARWRRVRISRWTRHDDTSHHRPSADHDSHDSNNHRLCPEKYVPHLDDVKITVVVVFLKTAIPTYESHRTRFAGYRLERGRSVAHSSTACHLWIQAGSHNKRVTCTWTVFTTTMLCLLGCMHNAFHCR